ncbi:MAG: hypothetical protein SOX56_05870 [[Pasteurella] mairii]|uniref:Regulatory protein n=1 Tax=[Pasteurella] mairii TaxID=757 RepID=A0A379B493_9PAST|nr:hypothetical protein [[Pasteurella] mairii]SUB33341.1 Uncharacterised protein [[Pasteurella] mairii]
MTLSNLLDLVGVPKVASLCGISQRAVYKWRKSNSLPRTEYTDETNYSVVLSEALNGEYSADFIKEIGKPIKN